MKSNFLKIVFFGVFLGLTPLQTYSQQQRFGKLDSYYSSLIWYEIGFFEWSNKESGGYLVSDFYDPEKKTSDYVILRTEQNLDTLSADIYAESYIEKWPRDPASIAVKLELAHKQHKDKRFKKAIQLYEEALKLDTDKKMGDKVYYWLSESARSDSNAFNARAYLLKLADEFPKSPLAPSALYSRGALFLSEKNYVQASNAFELLRKRFPSDKMTRKIGTALGEAYYQQKLFDKCITSLKSELPVLQGEEESKAVFLIAESYNYLNDFDQASANYLRYANLNKNKPEERFAQYGLGWVYHKQQIYHWSAESFAKAAKGDDETARKALYYKAINEKLAGLFPQSMSTFEEFGKKYTEGIWIEEAYYEWAISSFEFGEYPKAIDILLQVIRKRDSFKQRGKLLSLLGEAYFANGEYTRALQAFEEAEKSVDINPDIKIQATFQKAWLLYRNQAYKQAQPIFEAIYRKNPNFKLAAEALFWSADCYYSEEDYGPAGAQFQQFVAKYPNHKFTGAALYSVGWCHFKMGEFEKTIEPLQNFLANYKAPPIALFPYDIDAHLRLGDAHYAIREYDLAIEHYSHAIGAEPGGDYALFQIGNCYYRSERTYEAVTNFRKMLRIYPYSRLREQSQYNIGYVYFLMGNYDQAILELGGVLKKYPKTTWAARAQYNIGDAYYNAGKYNEAVDAYKMVLSNHPKSDFILEAINGIQYAQLASGVQDSSEQIFESFIYSNPSSRAADRLRYRQAESMLQAGDYPSAIKSFVEYIRISTSKKSIADARYNLAEAYRLNNEESKSIKELQNFIKDYPDVEKTPVVLSLLGRVFLNKKDYDSSEKYFLELDKRFNSYKAEALNGLGSLEIGRQNYEKARTYFESGSKLFPNNDAMKLGLAKVNFEEERDDIAVPQLAEIAKSNTGAEGAEAQFLLGRVFQDKKQYTEALTAYSKVKILYEAYEYWVAKSLLESAVCYQKLGNPVEAKKTLKIITDRYSNTEIAKDAEAMLLNL